MGIVLEEKQLQMTGKIWSLGLIITNIEVIGRVKWGMGSYQMDSPCQVLPRGFTYVIATKLIHFLKSAKFCIYTEEHMET